MPCGPARVARLFRRIGWVDLVVLAFDHAGVALAARALGATRTIGAHFEALHMNALAKLIERGAAHRRHQQRETDRIGEETGRRKKRPGPEEPCPWREWRGRIIECREGSPQVAHGHGTLGAPHK